MRLHIKKSKTISLIGCGTTETANETGQQGEASQAESQVETQAEASGEDVTLTMWSIAIESDAFYEAYPKAIADFEAAHPGVKIKMETFENESYKTKLKSAVAAKELPDVFFTWAGGFLADFVASGATLCLDDYYETYSDQISKAALANDYYDGKLYGLLIMLQMQHHLHFGLII